MVGPLEQNVRLMSVLYPVTAALSVLIAIGVSVLLLFQSAREMAALRAMGCTRRRVTGMFSCQQGLTLPHALHSAPQGPQRHKAQEDSQETQQPLLAAEHSCHPGEGRALPRQWNKARRICFYLRRECTIGPHSGQTI